MALFHPLQENVSAMTEEEISKRIKELSSKIASVRRFSRNLDLQQQLTNALNTYREELRMRRIKDMQDRFKKARGEPDLGELINVE